MKKERKIIKFIKNNLLGFVIGGLIFGSVGVIADTIINSSNVAYKTSTVKGALDELYQLADVKADVTDLKSYFNDNTSPLNIAGKPVKINNTNFENMFITREVTGPDLTVATQSAIQTTVSVSYSGYIPIHSTCSVFNSSTDGFGMSNVFIYYQHLMAGTSNIDVRLKNNYTEDSVKINVKCDVLYVKNTSE